MTTLVKRILSAVIIAPLVLGAVYAGGLIYLAVLAVAGALMAFELTNMVHAGQRMPQMILHNLVVAVAVFVTVIAGPQVSIAVAGVLWLASMIIARLGRQPNRWMALTLPYLFAPLAAMTVLRSGDGMGLAVIFFILAITWATDIAAFFVGRAVGGPKLSPRYSPNKTWSGLAGGIGAAAISGGIAALLIGSTSVLVLGTLAGALAIIAQLGDILESAMKRFFHVKDSGTLIPGHGGILDRVDGLVTVAVVACALGAAHSGTFAGAASGLLIWQF